jgi:DNA recombination protein RmuC
MLPAMDLLLGAVAVCAIGVLAWMLSRVSAELARVARAQEDLRADVQRGRESSLTQLAQATQVVRADLGAAHRALAEVKALEQARARQMERAADSLRRLEAVVVGSSTRGAAGENILARALGQLPPDLLELNVPFGSRVVEYALRLPGGRWLPIDSKWTSVASLERLADAADSDRARLLEQVARDVRARIRDMRKYLDPQRTVGLAVLAVPDAVHEVVPECQGEGWREGVLIVPYGVALPFVLGIYRLAIRFGAGVDDASLVEGLRALEETLRRASDEVEGRLSRGLVQAENGVSALRAGLADAGRTTERLLRTATEGEALPGGLATEERRELPDGGLGVEERELPV